MSLNKGRVMKKILATSFIVLFQSIVLAQSIDLQEDTTINNLYDSRQGSCAMADIDNDGDFDLIISGADGQLSNRKTTLYTNDGEGNFTEVIGTGLSNWSEAGEIAFADVDGDADQDLLITGRDGSPNYYANFYLNDGSGNFTLDTTTPFEPSIGGNIEFADIDNDGDQDLFMTGYDNNNLIFSKLYQNDGTGEFSEVTSTPFLSVGGSASAFFDIDNDNDLDLILTGKNSNYQKITTLYRNDGSGNFSLESNTPFENVDLADIDINDCDNDGDLDVLINGENDSFASICQIYLNDGTGAFDLLIGTPFMQTSIGTVDFADFDDDNDMDVLVTGSVVGETFAAHIYENQGMNNFSLVDTLVPLYASSTSLSDIDNDNDGITDCDESLGDQNLTLNLTGGNLDNIGNYSINLSHVPESPEESGWIANNGGFTTNAPTAYIDENVEKSPGQTVSQVTFDSEVSLELYFDISDAGTAMNDEQWYSIVVPFGCSTTGTTF